MSTSIPTIWDIQPHTEAKHKILRSYFGAWVSILGQSFSNLRFADGFCGPGIYKGGEPGSPIVVLDEATKALKFGDGKLKSNLKVEFTFIDENSDRVNHLKGILSERKNEDLRIVASEPICGVFEEKIQPFIKSVKDAGGYSPALVFIDPFGVKGYTRKTIQDFLKIRYTEIFMLLDVDGIYRSLFAWEQNRKNVLAIFGEEHEAELLQISQAGDEASVAQEKLRALFVRLFNNQHMADYCLQFRMYATNRKPLFDLVFLSNSAKGFTVMKNEMWKSSDREEFIFIDSEHSEIEQLRLGVTTYEGTLWKLLLEKFQGQQVTGQVITDYVEQKTIYLSKHKTEVLRLREAMPEGQGIQVTRSGKSHTGYAAETLIRFPN